MSCLVANIGNFHTLAFSLRDGRILASSSITPAS